MEIMNTWKTDEDQQEQPHQKRSKNEQEERGSKRRTDEWQKYAEDLEAGAERIAEENRTAKVGGGADGDVMMDAIGASWSNESDLKYVTKASRAVQVWGS